MSQQTRTVGIVALVIVAVVAVLFLLMQNQNTPATTNTVPEITGIEYTSLNESLPEEEQVPTSVVVTSSSVEVNGETVSITEAEFDEIVTYFRSLGLEEVEEVNFECLGGARTTVKTTGDEPMDAYYYTCGGDQQGSLNKNPQSFYDYIQENFVN